MAKDIIATEDYLHLYLITPIYEVRTRSVNIDGVKSNEQYQKLVKELRTRKWIKKDAIVSVDDYVTSKHEISKNRSIIFDKYSNKFYATNHSTEEVIECLNQKTFNKPKIGFNT